MPTKLMNNNDEAGGIRKIIQVRFSDKDQEQVKLFNAVQELIRISAIDKSKLIRLALYNFIEERYSQLLIENQKH